MDQVYKNKTQRDGLKNKRDELYLHLLSPRRGGVIAVPQIENACFKAFEREESMKTSGGRFLAPPGTEPGA